MDQCVIMLLVVIGGLVLLLGVAWEEIKALQQDKRDWKNRYYGGTDQGKKQQITPLRSIGRKKTRE